jgi:molybdenum cofactor cytidylyltransferase
MRGADKLMEEVGGVPLLRRQALVAAGLGAPVLVTLTPDWPGRAAALDGVEVERRVIEDAREGLSASLRAGAAWAQAQGAAALMVVLPDLPELESRDLRKVFEGFGQEPHLPCRACDADGRPGHPTVFPARFFPALSNLGGDTGAQALFAQEAPRLIPLPGARATTDLDTPEEWARWRAARGAD